MLQDMEKMKFFRSILKNAMVRVQICDQVLVRGLKPVIIFNS